MHDQSLIRSLSAVAALTLAALACGLYFDFGSPAPPSPTQPAPTAPPPALPTAIPPAVAAASTEAPTAPIDLGAPESIDAAGFPESFGRLENRDGSWYLEDHAVTFAYHLNEAGERVVWMSLENHADWPIFIQETDGTWALGVEAWQGEIVLVNTNDGPANLTVLNPAVGDGNQVPTEQELAPYEMLDLATLPPGDYQLRFRFKADETFDLTCSIALSQESSFTFVVLPIGVAVSEPGLVPRSGADLDVRTSPLCEAGS